VVRHGLIDLVGYGHDTEHGRYQAPHPAFDRLCDIFTVAFRRSGADPWIGRRVPELFRRAGLEDVQVEARVQMYPPGNSRRTIRPDLVRAMRPQVLDMCLASEVTSSSSAAARDGSPADDSPQAAPSRMSTRSDSGASAGSSSRARS
jgi:hypothetical protein